MWRDQFLHDNIVWFLTGDVIYAAHFISFKHEWWENDFITEKPLPCTYYQKPLASPCVIIGSACFEQSFNLWFGHIYRVSTFCLNTPFQYNSSERVNFKWKNRLFGRPSFKAPSCRILNTVVSYYNRADAKNSVGGKVRGREGLFGVGLLDERLMCHQIDDGLFVCAQMSSRDRYGYGNGLQIEKVFYYFEFLMDWFRVRSWV